MNTLKTGDRLLNGAQVIHATPWRSELGREAGQWVALCLYRGEWVIWTKVYRFRVALDPEGWEAEWGRYHGHDARRAMAKYVELTEDDSEPQEPFEGPVAVVAEVSTVSVEEFLARPTGPGYA